MNNRPIIIALVLLSFLAAVAFAIGFLFYATTPIPQGTQTPSTNTGTQTPNTSGSGVSSSVAQSSAAVRIAFETEIAPYNTDNVRLLENTIASGYALQLWIGDNTGGEGLLQYDAAQNKWKVLSGGGGEWSVDGLVAEGVPADVAATLIAGLRGE